MLEIYLKNFQLLESGKIKNISFKLCFKFSCTIEFIMDFDSSNTYETDFNLFGSNYKLTCDINEITYSEILVRRLNNENKNFTINYEHNFDDIFAHDNINVLGDEKFDFFMKEESKTKGFMVYNLFVDTKQLCSKKSKCENEFNKKGYLLNEHDFDFNSYPSQINAIEQKWYQVKFIISLYSEQTTEPYKNNYETYQLEVGKENISVIKDYRIIESINPEYEQIASTEKDVDSFDAVSIKFFNKYHRMFDWKETIHYDRLYTFSGFEEYSIILNKEFLFKCKVIYKDFKYINRKLILFMFNLSDFVKINWNILLNKIFIINYVGDCNDVKFNSIHCDIYWAIYEDKIFMFIEEKTYKQDFIENNTNKISKSINKLLFDCDLENTNDNILILFRTDLKENESFGDFFCKWYCEINKSDYFGKNYFDNFGNNYFKPEGIMFEKNDIEENSESTEFCDEDEWRNYDDETKLQEDPDKFIDEACNASETYDDADYGDPYESWYESIMDIEIKILEIEIFSLEILKLKILLTYKYTGKHGEAECEISYLYLYRVKEFGNHNFSGNLIYIGAIEGDFFISILDTNNFAKTHLDNIFTQPLKIINDNIGFKLYKGAFHLTNFKSPTY